MRLVAISRRIGRWASRAIFIVAIGLLCLGAYASVPQSFVDFQLHWLRSVAFVAAIVFAVTGLINLYRGTTIREYLNRFEVFVAKHSEKRLRSWFIP